MGEDLIGSAGHQVSQDLMNEKNVLSFSPSLWKVCKLIKKTFYSAVKAELNSTLEGMMRINISAYIFAFSAMNLSSLPLMYPSSAPMILR